MTNYLVQPTMRRLFYSEAIRLTEDAEKAVLQLHLAMGGELSDCGECTGVLDVPRGDIRDWRSFDDAVTFDNVTSREEYRQVWVERFPDKMKRYTFVTTHSDEDGLSLTITDGQSSVVLSHNAGEYMIPTVCEILRCALTDFVVRKSAI